jgi:hypothetical protein
MMKTVYVDGRVLVATPQSASRLSGLRLVGVRWGQVTILVGWIRRAPTLGVDIYPIYDIFKVMLL